MDDSQETSDTVVERHTVGDDEELDYATLAKLGGRKDLLVHQDYINNYSGPLPYPWVEWFDHYPPPSLPPLDCSVPGDHEGFKHHGAPNLLTWNIPDDTGLLPTKRVRFQTRQRKMTYPMHAPPHHPTTIKLKRNKTKLPSLPNEPVNFSKLLAMEYQKEWVDDNKRRLREEKIRQQEKKEIQKQKLIEHTMKARKIAGVDKSEEERKPSRFIMKRFSNVPAKLKLPPL